MLKASVPMVILNLPVRDGILSRSHAPGTFKVTSGANPENVYECSREFTNIHKCSQMFANITKYS